MNNETTNSTIQPSEISEIAANLIHANPNQPRKQFDAAGLKELADSIKTYGLIQPISVRPMPDGTYTIIAGERRYRAMATILGYASIPCIVRAVDDLTMQELALIENISRADMTLTETAAAYRDLLTLGFTLAQISERTGKSQRVIQQHLDLLTVAPHLQKLLENGRLRWSLCEELARLSPSGQEEAAEAILSRDLGVQSARRLILAIRNREHQIEMFPTVRVTTKEELDAHAKYERAMQQITDALSLLDDDTLVGAAVMAMESPYKETVRLDLMAKQIRRIQRGIEYRQHVAETTHTETKEA